MQEVKEKLTLEWLALQIMNCEINLLISRIKDNDELAFNALFDLYWEKLYSIAWARLNDSEVAKDIVQELFITLWQRRRSLDIRGSVDAYLKSAVKLSVISHFRSKSKEDLQLQDAATRMAIIQDAVGNQEDYVLLEELISNTVAKMPALLQQVYTMRNENRSIKEIAADLGIAEQTVRNYTSEVLKRLRLVIKDKHPEKYGAYLSVLIMLVNK